MTFPTPEKTILFGLIPDLIALSNSPPETTSAPDPSFFNTFNTPKFEFAY